MGDGHLVGHVGELDVEIWKPPEDLGSACRTRRRQERRGYNRRPWYADEGTNRMTQASTMQAICV